MSYVSEVQDPRRRAGALAGTIAVNAAIGAIVLAGLTMSGMRPVDPKPQPIIEFKTPPPPVPPPSPTPTANARTPKPVAPVPPIVLPPMSGPTVEQFDPTKVVRTVDPIPDPGPSMTPTPRPSASFTPAAARPSNDVAGWITADDYPRRPLVDGKEGTARYRLVIGTTGRVSSCEITQSTGDRLLDQATCRFITRRARFEAATSETGARVLGTYTGTVRWQIPD
jgi:protein TonB